MKIGSYSNIRFARTTISNLILGTPANKVYSQMRHVASRKRD